MSRQTRGSNNKKQSQTHARAYPLSSNPARGIDPTGRVDIALCRLLETAVAQYADVPVRAIYTALQPQINMGIRAVVGPRTSVGVTAKQAVSALQIVAREIASGNGGRKDGAA